MVSLLWQLLCVLEKCLHVVLSFRQMENKVEIKGNCTFISEVFNKYKTNIVVQALEMYHLCFGNLYRFFRPFCKVILKAP